MFWLITSIFLQGPLLLSSQKNCTTVAEVDLVCEEELSETSGDEEEDLTDEQLAAINCKMQQQTLPGVIKVLPKSVLEKKLVSSFHLYVF